MRRAVVVPRAGAAVGGRRPRTSARFRRILQRACWSLAALLCLVLPLHAAPEADRAAPPELPPRLAKLLLEREPPPPPPPAGAEAASRCQGRGRARAAAKPSRRSRAPEPTARQPPVPEARNPQPNKPPGEELDGARRKAAGVGLLAMKDELAETARRAGRGAAEAGHQARPRRGHRHRRRASAPAPKPGLPARAMITSNATGGSGGINTAAYSRDTGGGGLAGRATTLVEGVAGGGGGGGPGGGGVRGTGGGDGTGGGGGGKPAARCSKGGSGKASRSIEEIKLVFERNKGAIYAHLQPRAARRPGAAGQGGAGAEDRAVGRGGRLPHRLAAN